MQPVEKYFISVDLFLIHQSFSLGTLQIYKSEEVGPWLPSMQDPMKGN